MRGHFALGLGCCLILIGPGRAAAQTALPAAAPPAAAPPAAASPATAQAAAGAAKGPFAKLMECLCPTPAQWEAKREKFCNCPLGRLVNSMLKPVTTFSGGLIPDICPPTKPTTADLAKPGDTPLGAAAQIQKVEAEAKARRAAVRYLGTVDCHWYPEAEAALIAALRTDPNECVRLEAATALSRGCCCTKPIMEALTICVTSSSKDKHPSETSPRVRAIAYVALQRCLSCPAPAEGAARPEPPEKAPEPHEKAPAPGPMALVDLNPVVLRPLPAHYRNLAFVSYAQVAAEARRAITAVEQEQLAGGFGPAPAPAPEGLMRTGNRNLLTILKFSLDDPRPTTNEPPLAPGLVPVPAQPGGR